MGQIIVPNIIAQVSFDNVDVQIAVTRMAITNGFL